MKMLMGAAARGSQGHMNFRDFHESIFELCDMWTDGCEEHDYTACCSVV